MDSSSILDWAKATFDNEIEHLEFLKESLDANFVNAVNLIFNCQGRLVLCGIGKSAIIAQKIAASLNSTGTPCLFLHAAEAVHGDLGMVQRSDLVLMISNSGNSPEIKALIPLLKGFKVPIIGIGSKSDSKLGQESDVFIQTPLKKEACPNGLAPTTSTTMQLLVGDAITVALIHLRKFGAQDFSKFHPGGSLGKKLYLSLSDLLPEEKLEGLSYESTLADVAKSITKGGVGACVLFDENQSLYGIITDGDLRRQLSNGVDLSAIKAKDIASQTPLSADLKESAYDVFLRMEEKSVTQVLVLEDGRYCGLIHLHDILKAGIF